jgi:lysophospholipase L1-like esterase
MMATILAIGCGDTPTTPTPPPAPGALELTCPAAVSTVATSAGGTSVFFPVPTPIGGRTPVTVTCSATSGQVFPVGTTTVTCTARDVVNQLAACAFDVRVTPAPRLSRSRFLAFGDSITAGEVTAPNSAGAWGRLIVVPAASYPTVLGQQLTRSFPLQAITVQNAGLSGQSAAAAVPRFTSVVQSAQPEVVLLLMGYNDIDTPSTVAAAANALTTMAREGRTRGARVFIATLTPSLQGRPRSLDPALIDTLNIRIRQIAVTEGAVLVDLYQSMLASAGAWIGVDGLHPNEAGYARMADLFFDAIRTTLQSP